MSSMTKPDSLLVGPPGDDDRYELLRACGEGGEALVYKGQFPVEGQAQAVAIKMSRRGPEEPEEAFIARAKAWQAQIRIVQSIRHPSIVGMRETFIGLTPHRHLERPASQAVYLAMLWVEGPNLSTWVPDHPERTFRIIRGILISIASGLSHLHTGVDTDGRSIFHRDVKPSNVIITDDDKVVLVDFGLARGEARKPAGGGTPGYVAPEVRREGKFSAASDLYGLAGIAFYLITGRHPSDKDDIETFRRALEAAPFVARLPLLGDVVLAGLQPEPSDRPTGVAAWVRQLEGAGSTTPYPGGDLPPPAPDVPAASAPLVVPEDEVGRRRRRRRRRTLAVFATLLVVALAAAILTRPDPSQVAKPPDPSSTTTGVAAQMSPATLAPTTNTTTATSVPTSTTPGYAFTSEQLNAMLLTATDIARSGFLTKVGPSSGFLLPGWVCRSSDVQPAPTEDEQAEYYGAGPYQEANIGSEIMQFSSTSAADEFLDSIESIAPTCGMIVRGPSPLGGAERVVRLRDPERESRAYDRVFFRKRNVVGQVASAIPSRSTVAADSLIQTLVQRVP